MEEKYKMIVPARKSPCASALVLSLVLIVCILLLKVATFLPAPWAFQIVIIFLSAVFINRLLKQGIFSTMYILYEDSLHQLTRYGFISSVTAIYQLDETCFGENTVTYKGKTTPFYPDEHLKKLLNI